MLFDRVCEKCTKNFQSNLEHASICYRCALRSFTGGKAPEVSDLNSATLVSGEVSEREWAWFQEDLREADCPEESDCYQWWEGSIEHRKWNNGARDYRSAETQWRWKSK